MLVKCLTEARPQEDLSDLTSNFHRRALGEGVLCSSRCSSAQTICDPLGYYSTQFIFLFHGVWHGWASVIQRICMPVVLPDKRIFSHIMLSIWRDKSIAINRQRSDYQLNDYCVYWDFYKKRIKKLNLLKNSNCHKETLPLLRGIKSHKEKKMVTDTRVWLVGEFTHWIQLHEINHKSNFCFLFHCVARHIVHPRLGLSSLRQVQCIQMAHYAGFRIQLTVCPRDKASGSFNNKKTHWRLSQN